MMKPLIGLIALGGLAACAQTPAETARAAQQAQATQLALDKELAGLVPKGQMACLPPLPQTQVSAYGKTLIYSSGRSLKYRSETTGGCESVARGDILVTVSNGGRTCQGDISQTVAPVGRMVTGSCALGPFTEYSKP